MQSRFMKTLFLSLFLCTILFSGFKKPADDHPTLAIGSTAPDFHLPDVNGKMYSLASFKNNPVLVVIFTCNHCPTAQAYEDRIMNMVSEYQSKNVGFAVISGNDPLALRLDELDF